jgi:Zn finger protein HypA/HybF involved in hydrogenase expression
MVAGGIKLYVQNTDFSRALEIISSVHIELNDDSEIEASEVPLDDVHNEKLGINCPNCGSDNVRLHGLSEKILAASILILGIPIPVKKHTFYCFNCNSKFKLNK